MLEGFRKLSLIRFLDQPIASSTTRKMFTGGKSYSFERSTMDVPLR